MDNAQQSHVPANTHLMAEQDAESDTKKIRWFFKCSVRRFWHVHTD